ncbi:hypothetical protein Dsin_009626 [Dipteronia sinensis]|uniref:Uncharacterized protein n=1 Tax=Dipteronia sinensis TaxID=43782 RepID=A0AAE0AQZ6_9ROSI|nr:hypothetical protein Dsin_009626 [Dipteronia sinensis]
MPILYELMRVMKDAVKQQRGNTKWIPNIIQNRWDKMLNHHIHAAAYLDDDEGNPDPQIVSHARDMGINVEQVIREEVGVDRGVTVSNSSDDQHTSDGNNGGKDNGDDGDDGDEGGGWDSGVGGWDAGATSWDVCAGGWDVGVTG